MIMRKILILVAGLMCVGTLQGCGALMHPRSGEILAQAKGKTGQETLVNLLGRMEATAKAARAGLDVDANLAILHDQQYAFYKGLCGVTEAEAKTPAYAKLGTLTRELRPIMHRLMHTKDHQVRDAHLDLYLKRIDEMREALLAMKA
jgi:hypothetical protein